MTVAFLLGVLLAGLVAALALRPGAKLADLKRWMLWALVAVPVVFLLLRAGSYGLALLAALGAAVLRRGLPQFLGGGQQPAPGSTTGEQRPGTSARPKRMSRREALEVLGLPEGASKDDVLREYRRLMKRLHPDVGGSSYLATKLNEAREVLS
ncbi:MAG: DnaJ domain-containing protein [Polyangiaceae bacterium]